MHAYVKLFCFAENDKHKDSNARNPLNTSEIKYALARVIQNFCCEKVNKYGVFFILTWIFVVRLRLQRGIEAGAKARGTLVLQPVRASRRAYESPVAKKFNVTGKSSAHQQIKVTSIYPTDFIFFKQLGIMWSEHDIKLFNETIYSYIMSKWHLIGGDICR